MVQYNNFLSLSIPEHAGQAYNTIIHKFILMTTVESHQKLLSNLIRGHMKAAKTHNICLWPGFCFRPHCGSL